MAEPEWSDVPLGTIGEESPRTGATTAQMASPQNATMNTGMNHIQPHIIQGQIACIKPQCVYFCRLCLGKMAMKEACLFKKADRTDLG